MYGETLHFQCQHQQWQHEIPGRKINFCSKFTIKTLLCYLANADIGTLNSLHKFLKKCLSHTLVKFEQNSMVQTTQKFELLTKNLFFFFITIFVKHSMPF